MHRFHTNLVGGSFGQLSKIVTRSSGKGVVGQSRAGKRKSSAPSRGAKRLKAGIRAIGGARRKRKVKKSRKKGRKPKRKRKTYKRKKKTPPKRRRGKRRKKRVVRRKKKRTKRKKRGRRKRKSVKLPTIFD